MQVLFKSLECMHLDSIVFKMSLQNVLTIMALYGLADAHGYFSLNDIQFWALMNHLTDLPLRTIETFFFRLDYDYTGQMNFVEFQLVCCWLIAAKDRVTKEYLQRHFDQFIKIMETGKRKSYIPLYDFVKIGHFMGWNLGTMDRLYKYWDRSFELERYRVKLDFVMTFIIFAIDHERATESRRRIAAVKEWKTKWLWKLENVVMDFYLHDAVPAPPLMWSQIIDSDLPFIKAPKETQEEKGLCEYCIRIYCGLICLPWVLCCGLMYFIWIKSEGFQKTIKWTLGLFICKPCWKCWGRCQAKCSDPADDPHALRIPANSTEFYYRNKQKRREKPIFRYLQKEREEDGLFRRTDPWHNSWLKTQLHLEKLEKQLVSNRIKFREENKLVLKDTWGATGIHYANYIAKERKRAVRYRPRPDPAFQPDPTEESQIVIDPEEKWRAKYPVRFLQNYSPKEILKAEFEVKTKELEQSKGKRRKEPSLTFSRLRETVGGLSRRRKEEAKQKKLKEEMEETRKVTEEKKRITILKQEADQAKKLEEAEKRRKSLEEAEKKLKLKEEADKRKNSKEEAEKRKNSKEDEEKRKTSKGDGEKRKNSKEDKEKRKNSKDEEKRKNSKDEEKRKNSKEEEKRKKSQDEEEERKNSKEDEEKRNSSKDAETRKNSKEEKQKNSKEEDEKRKSSKDEEKRKHSKEEDEKRKHSKEDEEKRKSSKDAEKRKNSKEEDEKRKDSKEDEEKRKDSKDEEKRKHSKEDEEKRKSSKDAEKRKKSKEEEEKRKKSKERQKSPAEKGQKPKEPEKLDINAVAGERLKYEVAAKVQAKAKEEEKKGRRLKEATADRKEKLKEMLKGQKQVEEGESSEISDGEPGKGEKELAGNEQTVKAGPSKVQKSKPEAGKGQ